jgi:hypothetical protein
LVLFVPEKPDALGQKLENNQTLDPESAGERFEPLARPGLLANLSS